MVEQVYRGRKPKASPLWQCLSRHFHHFLQAYQERYQPRFGFLLLKDLCRIAHQCLLEFLRTSLGLPGGVPPPTT